MEATCLFIEGASVSVDFVDVLVSDNRLISTINLNI